MKKILIVLVAVAVGIAAFGTVGAVYAQTQTPPVQSGVTNPGWGGRGARGGYGMMASADGTTTGPIHDELISALAAKLGISVDDINAKLAEGQTLYQIATDNGLTLDEFRSLMLEVHPAGMGANGQAPAYDPATCTGLGMGMGGMRGGARFQTQAQ